MHLAKKILQNRWIQQLIFWSITYFILLNIFASSSSIQPVDRLYTIIFIFTLFIPVMINLYYLMPVFLNAKRYWLFFLLSLLNIVLFSIFNLLLFNELIDYILPGYYFISYYSFLDISKFFVVVVGMAVLLKMAKEWFYLNEEKQKTIILQKEKMEAELKALNNQLNPHFLFNSLNLLYNLALYKKDKTAEAIISLSDILRYVIYQSAREKVTIAEEVELIANYIQLQQLRTGLNASVTFDSQISNPELLVAPLLFLPLIENSFKHGLKKQIPENFIQIILHENQDQVKFTISNSKSLETAKDDSHRGVGLQNIQNRLNLIYPGKHEFKWQENTFEFTASIKLQAQ
jgi:sensor histidine kinase YesM